MTDSERKSMMNFFKKWAERRKRNKRLWELNDANMRLIALIARYPSARKALLITVKENNEEIARLNEENGESKKG